MGSRTASAERSPLDHWSVSAIVLLVLIGVTIALWLWLPERMAGHLPSLDQKGQYGDSYGAVTSLFTGLAFAGLIFTILLQHREIKLQRADFAAQIEEMQLSRDEIAKQSSIHEKQLKQAIVQLKFRVLELEVEHIKLQSYQVVEGARADRYGPQLLGVTAKMEELIASLETDA